MQAKRAEEGHAKGGDAKGGAASPNGEGIQMTEATFMCGALSLSERRAEQIMTRMADVYGLYTDERLDFPLMSRIYGSGFTRIPIFKRVPCHNASTSSDLGVVMMRTQWFAASATYTTDSPSSTLPSASTAETIWNMGVCCASPKPTQKFDGLMSR